jgi:hypothetical protein
MTFTKIQVIKMLRDNIPGLGLRDAKTIVDRYELKTFEDRMARVMGEEIRQELRSWAMVYVKSRDEAFNVIIPDVNEYKYSTITADEPAEYDRWVEDHPDYSVITDDEPNPEYYCDCSECEEDRDYRSVIKRSSHFWSNETGIEVLDPDGWNRMDYEKSWAEEITRDEFIRRAGMSTCKAWPDPLYDE